jgi:FkbM family methyltransferase
MPELRMRLQIATTRAATRLLQVLGIRDPIVRWRIRRQRVRRTAAEARGEDRLSRPALHEMDTKLDAIIGQDNGFFVEAGANDGFTQSNTYWLERFRAWQGLLVEPMPELAAEARLSRPCATVMQCCLVSSAETRSRIPMRFGDLMSMVDGARDSSWPAKGTVLGWRDSYELSVEARTLSSLLDDIDAPEVDLLSLDVEGFERQVLEGLDLKRHAPRYVLVEIHDRVRDRPPLDAILAERYMEHSWLSPLDLLYVRRDLARARLQAPVTERARPKSIARVSRIPPQESSKGKHS